jgi:hypothetical protein
MMTLHVIPSLEALPWLPCAVPGVATIDDRLVGDESPWASGAHYGRCLLHFGWVLLSTSDYPRSMGGALHLPEYPWGHGRGVCPTFVITLP